MKALNGVHLFAIKKPKWISLLKTIKVNLMKLYQITLKMLLKTTKLIRRMIVN